MTVSRSGILSFVTKNSIMCCPVKNLLLQGSFWLRLFSRYDNYLNPTRLPFLYELRPLNHGSLFLWNRLCWCLGIDIRPCQITYNRWYLIMRECICFNIFVIKQFALIIIMYVLQTFAVLLCSRC